MSKMIPAILLCALICGCFDNEPLITGHISQTYNQQYDIPQETTIPAYNNQEPLITARPSTSIKIASWNLQRFGPTKASNINTMNEITEKISQYDIVILQEITDESGNAFDAICNRMLDYKCAISERTGTTSYQEQYGVFYSNAISLNDDYMISTSGMERFPYVLNFTSGDWTFNLVTAHTKPENTQAELMTLEYIMNTNKKFQNNTIIIGDLNAGCGYYKITTEFLDRDWLIPNSADTTTGHSNCAYDRIITSVDVEPRTIGWAIDNSITEETSDHYLIYGIFDTN